MKKIIVLFTTLVFISCGTSKLVQQSKKAIKGQWTLNAVTYDESGMYKVNLLQDTSASCFEGSTWQFIPNNNSGTYNISSASCPLGIRNFIFTIEDVDASTGYQAFLLKPTDAKHKSETNQGFRLQLVQLSETTMQLQQSVNVEGKPFVITMNFTKQ